MFSGFQSNAFQTGFQIARSGTPPPSIVDTTGGFNEQDYKRYRKYLESLQEVTSEKRKYPKAIEAARELQELPVETPELKKLTSGPVIKGKLSLAPEINYELLQRDIELLRAYLDIMGVKRARIAQELDDETAFLLMIQ